MYRPIISLGISEDTPCSAIPILIAFIGCQRHTFVTNKENPIVTNYVSPIYLCIPAVAVGTTCLAILSAPATTTTLNNPFLFSVVCRCAADFSLHPGDQDSLPNLPVLTTSWPAAFLHDRPFFRVDRRWKTSILESKYESQYRARLIAGGSRLDRDN